jgi:hypothetical protein
VSLGDRAQSSAVERGRRMKDLLRESSGALKKERGEGGML